MTRKVVKREKDSKDHIIGINSEKAASLFKKVYLGGLIGDSVVSISSDGHFTINAIDITGSLFVSCSERVSKKLDEREIGVGDLKMMIEIFSAAGEDSVSLDFVDGNRMLVAWPKKRGTINYLLKDTELVATSFKGTGDPYKKLVDVCDVKVKFTTQKQKDVLALTKTISVSETRKIQLVCNKKIVSFHGGLDTGHKFNIDIGKVSGKSDSLSLVFNAEFLIHIFDVLDGDVELLFGEKTPLVIVQDRKNFWSLEELVS